MRGYKKRDTTKSKKGFKNVKHPSPKLQHTCRNPCNPNIYWFHRTKRRLYHGYRNRTLLNQFWKLTNHQCITPCYQSDRLSAWDTIRILQIQYQRCQTYCPSRWSWRDKDHSWSGHGTLRGTFICKILQFEIQKGCGFLPSWDGWDWFPCVFTWRTFGSLRNSCWTRSACSNCGPPQWESGHFHQKAESPKPCIVCKSCGSLDLILQNGLSPSNLVSFHADHFFSSAKCPTRQKVFQQ